MSAWWQRFLRGPQVLPLELRFFLDVDAAGRQVVRIYRVRGETRQAIADVRPLFQYGYREPAGDGQTTYVLRAEDWQTLQALKDQHPQFRPDGALVFDVLPPVLRYLRAKPAVQQTSRAQALRIEERPLRPAAAVDFSPDTGLHIQTGYAAPGGPALIPAGQLQVTDDGGYARVGDRFIPLSRPLGQTVQSWLERGSAQVQPDQVPEFFLRDLVLLKTQFRAVLTDQAQQVRVIEQPAEPAVSVEMNEPGWLDFTVDYGRDGFALPQGLLARKAAGDRYHRADPHTWIAFDPATVKAAQERLARMGATARGEGYRVPASQFADLEDFIRQMGGRAEAGAAYRAFLDRLTGFQPDEAYQLSPAAEQDLQRENVTLRPYQRGGIHWLRWLHDNGLHGILADDMGLGKTIQAISALRAAYEASGSQQHSLILAPKSVLPHWERELHRYYPEMPVYRYHGQDRQRELLQASRPRIFLTTYGTAAADIAYLAGIPFFYVILDEATQIKNPDTQRTLAVKALNAGHRLAMSGTPIENRPAEVWSLFDFLMRGYLGTQGAFDRLFEGPILAGDRAAAARLGRRIRPFTLRRTKEAVAKDLPEKIELEEWCDLTAEQRQLYGGLQDEVRRVREALERGENVNYTANVLPVIQKLKQICDHPALVTGEALPALPTARLRGPAAAGTAPGAPGQGPAPAQPGNGRHAAPAGTLATEGGAGGSPAAPAADDAHAEGGAGEAAAVPATEASQGQAPDTATGSGDAAAALPSLEAGAASPAGEPGAGEGTAARDPGPGTAAAAGPAPVGAALPANQGETPPGRAAGEGGPGDGPDAGGPPLPPADAATDPAGALAAAGDLLGRSEKFDWIVTKVLEIVQGQEQAVVFSHFLGMLSLLEVALARYNVPYIRIDGSTENRQALIDRFNAHEAQVALCSILAAGYGINLTAANHVIHADRWWNPAVEDQATDRVHRIGQDRTVYVHLILTEGTLEERIDHLLESKRGLADRVINAGRGGPGGWTREELISLLQPLDAPTRQLP